MLLTSCAIRPDNQGSTTPSEKRNYISLDVTYSEQTAQYAFKLKMDMTETAFAKYFFEESIEEKDREACIEVTDKVLSNLTLDEVVPEIYIFTKDRYNYKSISDHKLYYSVQEWKTVEYLTDVLLVAYGERAHYGTVFGYANYVYFLAT